MDIKDIMIWTMAATNNTAGIMIKTVFSHVHKGEGFSTNLFGKVIEELDSKTTVRRLDVVPTNEIEKLFEEFRQSYKGTKRGFATEFGNLKRKHPDWKDVVPKFMQAWRNEMAWHERAKSVGAFCPEYKNLQTWINQRCWEQEFNLDQLKNGNSKANINTDNASRAIRSLANEFV